MANQTVDKIRVLVVDDYPLFREGLRLLLATSDDVEVAGEAGDGREALALLETLRPDVVLMDIAMPTMSGLEAAPRMRKDYPDVRLLILSQHKECEYVVSMLNAGVAGYIPKLAPASELLSAIRAVHRGQMYLHPSVSSCISTSMTWFQREKEGKSAV
jgi:DNA-binding NarL/FixJ family response regulator